MLEDNYCESEKTMMFFPMCYKCMKFIGRCNDSIKGMGCAFSDDAAIPFDYWEKDVQYRKDAIAGYQKKELPKSCSFYLQCSMLGFEDDNSEADGIAENGITASRMRFSELDGDTKSEVQNIIQEDILLDDSTIAMIRKNGCLIGIAVIVSETDADYSWILPNPPEKHYFQSGEKRTGISFMKIIDNENQCLKAFMSMLFETAIENDSPEIYAVVSTSYMKEFSWNGFKPAGFKIGGNGEDEENGFIVQVRKTNEMLCN